MDKRNTIGIDVAKNSFYLFELTQRGKPGKKKKLSRGSFLDFLVQLEPAVVAMEACASTHYWGREITKLGHEVQLLPAQHVKGYLRGQKNDYNDARAIAEASQHGAIHSVPIKTIEQHDEQAFLQMRRHISTERTRLINHIRGLLGEYGIVLKRGSTELRKSLPYIMEDASNELTGYYRLLLNRQYVRLVAIEEELMWFDQQLKIAVKQDDTCTRLMEIPGFGPVVSKAVKAWMGDGKQFKRGRDASAALGLVPKQFSTGGREVLLGITKRGSAYLRALVVHGARSVTCRVANKTDPLSLWIKRLVDTRGFNKAAVALANKLMRIAWVVIARGVRYEAARPANILTC